MTDDVGEMILEVKLLDVEEPTFVDAIRSIVDNEVISLATRSRCGRAALSILVQRHMIRRWKTCSTLEY